LVVGVVDRVETVPNFGEQFREFRIEFEDGTWGFEFWKGSTRGFYPYIYIYIYILIGFEDILFFIIILILKLKIIFRKKTEIVF
jgi:hypothetical protein